MRTRLIGAAVCSVLLGVPPAHADKTAPGGAEVAAGDSWAFKLTPSYYMTTHQADATDVNLRANSGAHALWLGHYRRGGEFEQTRTGYEYTAQFAFVQLVPSLQLAAHGFAGGSLNAQVGDSVYALLGIGRTNTRDYYNLNFDPNDSLVYGVGTRLLPGSTLALYTVRDDRLHTGQTVTHALWRLSPDLHQRWTVDLSAKHGRATPDDDPVSGLALSIGYDNRDVFVRLARDRKVNFSNDDQTRVSVGLRF
jgi:hypothetical protein